MQSVANKVEPSIVDINSTLKYQDGSAAGTGIILSANGLVLTNNHVLEGSTDLTVTSVSSGKTYQAKVVGVDPTDDMAVIQLQGASGLTKARIGNSAKVRSAPGWWPSVTRRHRRHPHRDQRRHHRAEPDDHRQRLGRQATAETLHQMMQTNAADLAG